MTESGPTKRFVKSSLIYAIGDVLTKSTRVILIPFYLSFLTPSEIGLLAVLQAMMMASLSLLAFGLGAGVRRFYLERGESGDRYVSSAWWGRWLVALPAYVVVLLLGLIYSRFGPGHISYWLIGLAVTTGFMRAGVNIIESWFVIREEPVKFRTFSLVQFGLCTLLIVVLVAVFRLGVTGAILGEFLCYVIWTIVSAVFMLRAGSPSLGLVHWGEAWRYCMPVVWYVFFLWGLTSFDRLILNQFEPMNRIGIYDVGYQLAAFLSIGINAMRSAWTPHYYRDPSSDEGRRRFSNLASIYFFVIFYFALIGCLLAPEGFWLIELLSRHSYADAMAVFRIVVLGQVCLAVYVALNQPLMYHHRTGVLAVLTGVGLGINILFNYVLIGELGMGIWGAAWATVIAYAATALMSILAVRTFCPMPWEPKSAAFFLAVGGGLTIAGCCWVRAAWDVSLLPRIGLIAAFPLLTLIRVDRQAVGRWQWTSRFHWSDLHRLRMVRVDSVKEVVGEADERPLEPKTTNEPLDTTSFVKLPH